MVVLQHSLSRLRWHGFIRCTDKIWIEISNNHNNDNDLVTTTIIITIMICSDLNCVSHNFYTGKVKVCKQVNDFDLI